MHRTRSAVRLSQMTTIPTDINKIDNSAPSRPVIDSLLKKNNSRR